LLLFEWVELYNNASFAINVTGIEISNLNGVDNYNLHLPSSIPAGAYINISSNGSWANDTAFRDFKVGSNTYQTLNLSLQLSSTRSVWFDSADDVIIRYDANDCTLDYMQYGSIGPINGHPADSTSPSTWSGKAPSAPGSGESVSRIINGFDSDDGSDWHSFTTDVSIVTKGYANAELSQNGFGMIAPSITGSVIIDGSLGTEYTSASVDTFEYQASSYIDTYVQVKPSSGHLYLFIDTEFNFQEAFDYCEIAFDVDQGGGTVSTSDYKARISPQVIPQNDYFNGSGSAPNWWTNIGNTLPGWNMAAWPSGGPRGGMSFEFQCWLSDVGLTENMEIVGLMVHMYEQGNHYWWPDSLSSTDYTDHPYRYGDLYNITSPLIINEISPFGSGTTEWIELHNKATFPINITGINVTNQNSPAESYSIHLPSGVTSIPAGAYINITTGNGVNDTNFRSYQGSQSLDLYLQNTTGNFWNDNADDVVLRYRANKCVLDYMQYGFGPTIDNHPTDPTSTSSWSGPIILAPLNSQSLSRIPNGTDTNQAIDWHSWSSTISVVTKGYANYEVPEFPSMLLPLGGMIMLAFISLRRRQKGVTS